MGYWLFWMKTISIVLNAFGLTLCSSHENSRNTKGLSK